MTTPTHDELESLSAAANKLWSLDENRLDPNEDYAINLQVCALGPTLLVPSLTGCDHTPPPIEPERMMMTAHGFASPITLFVASCVAWPSCSGTARPQRGKSMWQKGDAASEKLFKGVKKEVWTKPTFLM